MSVNQDQIDAFVMAAHGNLDRVKEMLEAHPELRDGRHSRTDEDALGAAAHVGNRPIAEYLLASGAPATIFSAAMLGDVEAVRDFLDRDPSLANAGGAHGIPLMVHAGAGGDTAVAELLRARGCREGFGQALHGAAMFGHEAMVRWLLERGVDDVNLPSTQGKTALDLARLAGHHEVVRMLEEAGGTEGSTGDSH